MQISKGNKILVPATSAVMFPTLEVKNTDGSSFKLPLVSNKNDANVSTLDTAKDSSLKMSPTSKLNDTNALISDTAKASLICLSFRASSGVRFVYICSQVLNHVNLFSEHLNILGGKRFTLIGSRDGANRCPSYLHG